MASAQLVVLFGLKDLGTPLCGLLPGGLVITSPQHLGQDRADFSTDPLAFWAFSDAGTHGAIVRYDCPLFGWNRVDFPKTEHKMQDGGGISQNRPFSQATEHGYVFDRIRRMSTTSRTRMIPSQTKRVRLKVIACLAAQPVIAASRYTSFAQSPKTETRTRPPA